MITSPLMLELLLLNYSGSPHPKSEVTVYKEARDYLFNHGMIDRNDELSCCTDKGRFFIEYLLTIPFPVAYWKIPDENRN